MKDNDIKMKDDIKVENSTDIFYKGFITGYGLAMLCFIIAILLYSKYIV